MSCDTDRPFTCQSHFDGGDGLIDKGHFWSQTPLRYVWHSEHTTNWSVAGAVLEIKNTFFSYITKTKFVWYEEKALVLCKIKAMMPITICGCKFLAIYYPSNHSHYNWPLGALLDLQSICTECQFLYW